MNLYIIINMLDRSIGWETELFLGNLAGLHPSCLVLFQFISLRSENMLFYMCNRTNFNLSNKIHAYKFLRDRFNCRHRFNCRCFALFKIEKTLFFSTNFQLISELHTLGLRSPTQQKLVSLLYAIMQCTFSTQPPNGLSAAQGKHKKKQGPGKW